MIAAIVQQLQQAVPALRLVEGAAGFQRASEGNPTTTPAAYVFLADEVADEDSIGAPIIQRLLAKIVTVLVLRNVGDITGAAATIDMDTLREQVRTALHGFCIDADHDPLAIDRSGLVAFRDGHLWWQMIWTTSYYVQGQ